VADYVDRLAAEIGSPPDAARAQALVRGCRSRVRIDGPQVQYDSHPNRRPRGTDRAQMRPRRLGLVRTTADGHRVRFGLAARPTPTGRAGWAGSRWPRCCC
jgi:hypothetical protein